MVNVYSILLFRYNSSRPDWKQEHASRVEAQGAVERCGRYLSGNDSAGQPAWAERRDGCRGAASGASYSRERSHFPPKYSQRFPYTCTFRWFPSTGILGRAYCESESGVRWLREGNRGWSRNEDFFPAPQNLSCKDERRSHSATLLGREQWRSLLLERRFATVRPWRGRSAV